MLKKLALAAAVTAATLAVALVLLEVGFSLWLTRWASQDDFLKYASYRQLAERKQQDDEPFKYVAHRYLGYVPTPHYTSGANRHNALGFRGGDIGPKRPGEIRIACLGGSTTYTTSIDDWTLSYPAQMEALLRQAGFEQVTVINGGVGGWSSWESMISFELRVLDLAPDVVVVYHGINDVHPRLVWPPSAYRGDNSGRRAPNTTEAFMPPVLEHSTFYRWLMVNRGALTPHADLTATLDRFPGSFKAPEFQRQVRAGTYPRGVFAQTPAMEMLAVNEPTYFLRNMANIVHVAQGNGVVPVIATFATHPGFEDQVEVSSEEYQRAYREQNEGLRRLCAATGAHLFDFARAMPRDKSLYVDGRHVTEAGARKKAALFADFLAEHVLPELVAR